MFKDLKKNLNALGTAQGESKKKVIETQNKNLLSAIFDKSRTIIEGVVVNPFNPETRVLKKLMEIADDGKQSPEDQEERKYLGSSGQETYYATFETDDETGNVKKVVIYDPAGEEIESLDTPEGEVVSSLEILDTLVHKLNLDSISYRLLLDLDIVQLDKPKEEGEESPEGEPKEEEPEETPPEEEPEEKKEPMESTEDDPSLPGAEKRGVNLKKKGAIDTKDKNKKNIPDDPEMPESVKESSVLLNRLKRFNEKFKSNKVWQKEFEAIQNSSVDAAKNLIERWKSLFEVPVDTNQTLKSPVRLKTAGEPTSPGSPYASKQKGVGRVEPFQNLDKDAIKQGQASFSVDTSGGRTSIKRPDNTQLVPPGSLDKDAVKQKAGVKIPRLAGAKPVGDKSLDKDAIKQKASAKDRDKRVGRSGVPNLINTKVTNFRLGDSIWKFFRKNPNMNAIKLSEHLGMKKVTNEVADTILQMVEEKFLFAGRGQGMGVGGQRQGDAGAARCKCTSCGKIVDHDRGIPCNQMICPVCGTKTMVGIDESRGQGMGVGGVRQGDGGAEVCQCPECGHEKRRERGVPCAELKCPSCGSYMIGKSVASETRGQGQGVGGTRQGDAGADVCKCPQCGAMVPHLKGIPCTQTSCPKCGTLMIGESVNEEQVGLFIGENPYFGTNPKSTLLKTFDTEKDASAYAKEENIDGWIATVKSGITYKTASEEDIKSAKVKESHVQLQKVDEMNLGFAKATIARLGKKSSLSDKEGALLTKAKEFIEKNPAEAKVPKDPAGTDPDKLIKDLLEKHGLTEEPVGGLTRGAADIKIKPDTEEPVPLKDIPKEGKKVEITGVNTEDEAEDYLKKLQVKKDGKVNLKDQGAVIYSLKGEEVARYNSEMNTLIVNQVTEGRLPKLDKSIDAATLKDLLEDIGDRIWNFFHEHPGATIEELKQSLKEDPFKDKIDDRLNLMVEKGSLIEEAGKYSIKSSKKE